MTVDIPGLPGAEQGVTSNGVPYVALPPEGAKAGRGLVVMWHGADPPRTEEALATAIPMRLLPAWRVYLGMPGHGRRSPKGGFEEIMRLAAQDALTCSDLVSRGPLLSYPVRSRALELGWTSTRGSRLASLASRRAVQLRCWP